MKKTSNLNIIIHLVFIFMILCNSCNKKDLNGKFEFKYLEKIGEINNFSNEESGYFWRINTFCCDDESNLYVTDSGWNKIFKFDSEGKFITSFGSTGQGPNEFLGDPKRSTSLRISFGNDNNLYLLDSGNNRLNILTKNFEFINRFSLPGEGLRIQDTPHANSKGIIYFVSNYEGYAIHRFDKEMNLENSFLPSHLHFESKYKINLRGSLKQFIFDYNLRKIISKNDHLFALSNYAMRVYHFNEANKLQDHFDIENKLFTDDFKNRLKKARGKKGFIFPFHLFLDQDDHLCLGYFNSSIENYEIYRYKHNGRLLDVLRFQNNVQSPFSTDNLGNFYLSNNQRTVIEKYRIREKY